MRAICGWMVSILVLVMAGPATAGKIGFVDAERAVVTVDEGAAKVRELEAWAVPERERVEQLGNRVNELRQQIAAKSRVASEETVRDLEAQEVEPQRRKARKGHTARIFCAGLALLASLAVQSDLGRFALADRAGFAKTVHTQNMTRNLRVGLCGLCVFAFQTSNGRPGRAARVGSEPRTRQCQ